MEAAARGPSKLGMLKSRMMSSYMGRPLRSRSKTASTANYPSSTMSRVRLKTSSW